MFHPCVWSCWVTLVATPAVDVPFATWTFTLALETVVGGAVVTGTFVVVVTGAAPGAPFFTDPQVTRTAMAMTKSTIKMAAFGRSRWPTLFGGSS